MFGWRVEEKTKIQFTITVNWQRGDGSITTTRDVDSLMRLHQRRRVDLRRGKRLGKDDILLNWTIARAAPGKSQR
jgi:hypothetical protein